MGVVNKLIDSEGTSHDLGVSASNVTGTLPIANGGTGATTAKAATINLINGNAAWSSVVPTERVAAANFAGTNAGYYTFATLRDWFAKNAGNHFVRYGTRSWTVADAFAYGYVGFSNTWDADTFNGTTKSIAVGDILVLDVTITDMANATFMLFIKVTTAATGSTSPVGVVVDMVHNNSEWLDVSSVNCDMFILPGTYNVYNAVPSTYGWPGSPTATTGDYMTMEVKRSRVSASGNWYVLQSSLWGGVGFVRSKSFSGSSPTFDSWKIVPWESGSYDISGIGSSTQPVYVNPSGELSACGSSLSVDVTGNSATATKLATARTIQTNLGSTSSESFDGSGNVTPGVTGTLPIANGGTGATTAANATVNIVSALTEWSSFNEAESVPAIGQNQDSAGRFSFSTIWTWIQGKISSVLGLTASNYGGEASTARTASVASSCIGNSATSTNVKYTHSNEINFKNVPSGQSRCWINYRNGDTDNVEPGHTMEYAFGNLNGGTTDVTLRADNFTGNSATASKVSLLQCGQDYADNNTNVISMPSTSQSTNWASTVHTTAYFWSFSYEYIIVQPGKMVCVDFTAYSPNSEITSNGLSFRLSSSNSGNGDAAYGIVQIKGKSLHARISYFNDGTEAIYVYPQLLNMTGNAVYLINTHTDAFSI